VSDQVDSAGCAAGNWQCRKNQVGGTLQGVLQAGGTGQVARQEGILWAEVVSQA